jgi:hypothetical protein
MLGGYEVFRGYSGSSLRLTVRPQLERTVLTEVVQLHPELLTVPELILRIARRPNDEAEKEEVRNAVRDLRRSGLARYRDDEVVEPTHAALRAYDLLTA